MTTITLGNVAPVRRVRHDPTNPEHVARLEAGGATVRVGDDGAGGDVLDHVIDVDPTVGHTTEFRCDPELSALSIAHELAGLNAGGSDHVWAKHSKAAPGFVLVDHEDPEKAALIKAILMDAMKVRDVDPGDITALVTNAGLDYFSKQGGGAASATAVATYFALTANSTAPAAGDTVLTGEIVTGGGGLVRVAATYSHTAGQSTYLLQKTISANGSDSLPVTINKLGVFDAASSGNMVFETVVTPAVTYNASGDSGTFSETVTV